MLTQETISLLYKVNDEMSSVRKELDAHMYGKDIPQEDKTYCQKVYGAICSVMDLL